MTRPVRRLEAVLALTKFERSATSAIDCDYAEGTFLRNPTFRFQIYFDDTGNVDCVPGTRIREMYIVTNDGTVQWSWCGMPVDRLPDWEFGWLLLGDVLAGIDQAVECHVANNRNYCLTRARSLIRQLVELGIARPLVISSMHEALLDAVTDD